MDKNAYLWMSEQKNEEEDGTLVTVVFGDLGELSFIR